MPTLVRILCIDDDDDQRAMLGKLFELESELNLKVYFAANLSQAIDQMRAVKFDAILLDWFLPDAKGHGVESIKKIRTIDENVPLVILTALDDIEANRLAIEASADGYLIKPAMPRNIVHTLYSVILQKKKPDQRVLRILSEIVKTIGRGTDALESAVER